jgi:hypothetical protein
MSSMGEVGAVWGKYGQVRVEVYYCSMRIGLYITS